MSIAIYPGSFNPWHEGHTDVLNKALTVFGRVQIAIAVNPDKPTSDVIESMENIRNLVDKNRVEIVLIHELLVDYIKKHSNIRAIVRGLRNGQDLEYERLQQYWNEDLAWEGDFDLPPTVYFVTDRNLVHISSSAIRAVEKIRGK
jgi:pantetheine-phosphate adenylyltransferase